MMPQMESNGPLREQSGSTYGQYEGNRDYTQQQYEEPQRPPQGVTMDDDFIEAVAQRMARHLAAQGVSGKVHAPPQTYDKNVLRIILAVISMLMLVLLAFLLVIVVGGTAGWISFCAASFAVFVIAAVALDKVK